MADDETNDDKLDYAEIGELIFNAYETILSRKKTIKTPFKPSISTDVTIKVKTPKSDSFDDLLNKSKPATNRDKKNLNFLQGKSGLAFEPYKMTKYGINVDKQIITEDYLDVKKGKGMQDLSKRFPTMPFDKQFQKWEPLGTSLRRLIKNPSYNESLLWLYDNALGLTEQHKEYYNLISKYLSNVKNYQKFKDKKQTTIQSVQGSAVLIGSPHIGYIPTGKVITGSVSGDIIPDDLLIPKEMRIGVPFDIGKFVEWHKKKYPVDIVTKKRDLTSFLPSDPLSMIDVSGFGGHKEQILHKMFKEGLAFEVVIAEKPEGAKKAIKRSLGWSLTPKFFETIKQLQKEKLTPEDYDKKFKEDRARLTNNPQQRGFLRSHDLRTGFIQKQFEELGKGHAMERVGHTDLATTQKYIDSDRGINEHDRDLLINAADKTISDEFEKVRTQTFIMLQNTIGARRWELANLRLTDLDPVKMDDGTIQLNIDRPLAKAKGKVRQSELGFEVKFDKNKRLLPINKESVLFQRYLDLRKEYVERANNAGNIENYDANKFQRSSDNFLFPAEYGKSINPQRPFDESRIQRWLSTLQDSTDATIVKILEHMDAKPLGPPKDEKFLPKESKKDTKTIEGKYKYLGDKPETTKEKRIRQAKEIFQKGKEIVKKRGPQLIDLLRRTKKQAPFHKILKSSIMSQKERTKQLAEKGFVEYLDLNQDYVHELLTRMSDIQRIFQEEARDDVEKSFFHQLERNRNRKRTIRGPKGDYDYYLGQEFLIELPGKSTKKYKLKIIDHDNPVFENQGGIQIQEIKDWVYNKGKEIPNATVKGKPIKIPMSIWNRYRKRTN